MRRAMLRLCLLVVAATTAEAQALDAKTRADLDVAREAVWRAWFGGDVATLERLIPPALAAGSPQSWEDRARAFAGSREFAAGGGRLVDLRFDSTVVSVRGNVAVMQARYAYTLQARDGKRTTTRGYATEVFVREKGRWVNPFWYLDN